MLIPWGGDGGVQHAVTVAGHYIFDSTTGYALHLTQEVLTGAATLGLAIRERTSKFGSPSYPEENRTTLAMTDTLF